MKQAGVGTNLVWFVAGAAIGGVIALLTAPQAGSRTRRIIREKVEDGLDSAAEAGRELRNQGRRLAEGAAHLAERAKQAVSA